MMRQLKILGFCNRGYEGQVFGVETDIRSGFPGFDIVGLADSAIKESRERIKTALRNCGFKFPNQRVLVSLSPASVPKSGSLLDLAIALSILFASAKENHAYEDLRIMVAGELTLSGEIVSDGTTIGAVKAAKKNKCRLCLVPFETDEEGVITVKNLTQAFIICGQYLNKTEEIPNMKEDIKATPSIFEDVIGLNKEKELISMAASGWHSMLFFGPPGVGKTLLSNKVHLLLAPRTKNDQLAVEHIYGCSEAELENPDGNLRILVPHDCSLAQFIGGSVQKSPGLGALANTGTLILDELNKYTPTLLESVKDTYDKGMTMSSKSGETITYPARFLMVANMNPCPCGGLGSEHNVCTCTSQKVSNHWSRIGKAFLERFEVRIPIEENNILNLINEQKKDDTYYIDKVKASSDRQKARFKDTGINCNGQAHYLINPFSFFRKETTLFASIQNKISVPFNTRTQLGIITLSRTIADYEDRNEVTENDILNAMELKKYCVNGDFYWKTING